MYTFSLKKLNGVIKTAWDDNFHLDINVPRVYIDLCNYFGETTAVEFPPCHPRVQVIRKTDDSTFPFRFPDEFLPFFSNHQKAAMSVRLLRPKRLKSS